MKLRKGVVVFLILLIIILIIGFDYLYIYQPRMQRIEQLDRDIQTTAQKIEQGKQIAARLGPLKEEYAALKEKLSFLEVMLPKEKEIPDLLVMVQDTMDEFKVDFTNFTPQNIAWEKERIYGKMPISMNLTANYFDLIGYLDRIENLPRIIDVQSLNINKGGRDTDKLNISINMLTYVLRKEGTP